MRCFTSRFEQKLPSIYHLRCSVCKNEQRKYLSLRIGGVRIIKNTFFVDLVKVAIERMNHFKLNFYGCKFSYNNSKDTKECQNSINNVSGLIITSQRSEQMTEI